ncbi:MAG TPA: efflux RND transporter permease subunit, partial [Lacipirellulaceae bacterium]|nr:efflux RND transporter permease subunit [Lacipirellulaceae bacterium]
QVEIPRPVVRSPQGITTIQSANDLARIPLKATPTGEIHVGDVSDIRSGTMPGQYDRYNMKRQITLAANIAGSDLGSVSQQVARAIRRAGTPPRGVQVETRGQIPPMRQMESGLAVGLGLAVIAVFLLLTANFQSLRLAFVTISTVPAVVAGVAVMLLVTGTQLNIQSFIGSIMAVGVAMANAILLVTFAEHRRREGMPSDDAAANGAASRLRAILMTSCAMVAGMLPMALGFGESGQQNGPLGRAVIGGLIAATAATLLILPTVFAMVQQRASRESSSLHPDDLGAAEQQLVGGPN